MNRDILRLAIPSIISNITVPLLSLIDLAIVGHLGETAFIGAIAVAGLFFNILYWNFGFLRMGTSGLTAQAYGRQDKEGMVKVLVQALTVGLGVALSLIILQYPLERLAFYFLGSSQEVETFAVLYIRICIWGAPAVLCLYGFYGWFVGMQNSRYQMYIAVTMNIANILFNFLFVYGFDMKVEGVALGTLIAQYIGLLLAIALWKYKYSKLSVIKWRASIKLSAMKRFFTVNRDIFLRMLCLVAVTSFFTAAGARQGDIMLAVNTLLMQLFTLFSYIMDGFAYAGEALAGRFTGALDLYRLKKAVRYLFGWGGGMAVLFTLLYMIGGQGFLGLLTDDIGIIEAAVPYFYWILAVPVLGFSAFLWDGIFIGVTATRQMLIAMFISAAAFFAIYYLGSGYKNNYILWTAFLTYLFSRGLVQTILSRKILTEPYLNRIKEKSY